MNASTLAREIDLTLEGVIEAALELESRRCYGKPVAELLSGLECLQETINKARAALKTGDRGDGEGGAVWAGGTERETCEDC